MPDSGSEAQSPNFVASVGDLFVPSKDWMAELYDKVRAIASWRLRRERVGHTFQTTALVHEAYLRMSQAREPRWTTAEEFCAAAAKTIRRVLVDHARARRCRKRGGRAIRQIALDTVALLAPELTYDLCDLDDALKDLESIDERRSKVVEMRYFGGMKDAEIGEALGISERTVRVEWNGARAWLLRRLSVSDAE